MEPSGLSARPEAVWVKVEQQAEWTIPALREAYGQQLGTMATHFDAVLREHELRYQQRFEAQEKAAEQRFIAAEKANEQRFLAQEKANSTALTAAEKAVDAALQAAKEAVAKAELATEKRFEGVNEFRQSLQDLSATMLTRTEGVALINALDARVTIVQQWSDRSTGGTTAGSAHWTWLVGGIGVIVGVVAIAERVLGH